MSFYILSNELWFPPVTEALEDGFLAMGADLSRERLLLAYTQGIFPWYEGPTPMWWAPDPRFVLFPDALKVSKSMKTVLRNGRFSFSMNRDFGAVISGCQKAARAGQDSTWINEDVIRGYTALYEQGYALSAEALEDGQLVGGLYGVLLGNVFFGESMFSLKSNASKFAFIKLVEILKENGIQLIDCQSHTDHLESLGARMIPRKQFMSMLHQQIPPLDKLQPRQLNWAH